MIPLVAKTRIGGMSAGASSALEKGQVLAEKGKKNDKTGSGNRTTMASVDIEVLRLIVSPPTVGAGGSLRRRPGPAARVAAPVFLCEALGRCHSGGISRWLGVALVDRVRSHPCDGPRNDGGEC